MGVTNVNASKTKYFPNNYKLLIICIIVKLGSIPAVADRQNEF